MHPHFLNSISIRQQRSEFGVPTEAFSGLSQPTIGGEANSPQAMKEMAETLADIFLNGVLSDPQAQGSRG